MNNLNDYLKSPYSKGNNQRMYDLLVDFMLVEKWACFSSLLVLFNNKHVLTTKRFLDKMIGFNILFKNELKTDAHSNKFSIYRLTSHGVSLFSDSLESAFKPILMSEISVSTLIHSIDLQRLHARCIHLGYEGWYRPDYSFKKRNEHYSDAIATLDNSHYSFEVERYLKSPARYNKIFSAHVNDIYQTKIDKVYYVCPDIEIAVKIRNCFESIDSVECSGERFKTTQDLFKRFKYVDYSYFGISK